MPKLNPKSKLNPKQELNKSRFRKILTGSLTAFLSIAITVSVVYLFTRAGTLDPSAGPADTSKTLDDIYCAMTIDCTPTSYGIDSPGVAGSTMRTLQEIYDKAANFPLPDTGQITSYGTAADDAYYDSSNSFVSVMSYDTSSDNVVIDNVTGLMWKKCSEGLSGPSCGTGSATTYTWELAKSQCEGLDFDGHTDWRLPNAKELFSITALEALAVQDVKNSEAPYINQFVFPATVSSFYWSSTTYPYSTSYALSVYFTYGCVLTNNKTSSYYVRCVRGQ